MREGWQFIMSKKKSNTGSIFKTRSKVSLDPNSKKARRLRAKKERLSHLPKNHWDRFKFYLRHPKEIWKYWSSAEGRRMFLKIVGITILAVSLIIFLFLWIPSSVDAKNMDDTIKQRIQSTTNTYLDRNDQLLWEDSGSGQVLKFVESSQISDNLKNATVAIEDHNFYDHGGVSIEGIARALLNNLGGGSTQGGSTLTQQLMKQVFFQDEASERGIMGIPRKVKEVFLSVEAERSYSKDQILTYYLNVAPYGGRRNGVQSAAETYFAKDAADLSLAEAALIAGIPQYPSAYNPYNTEYNTSLLERYNQVLNAIEKYMPDKYSKEEIDAARAEFTIDNLSDKIQSPDELLVGAKAPHFVQMVKQNLEEELGAKVMGQGGLKIKTTLDIRVQDVIDTEINNLFNSSTPTSMGFDNAAVTMVDTKTGQVLGMRGSRDYNYPGYGAVNAATSFIQPGSSVKPEVYASLIDTQRTTAWGAGSMVQDNDGGRTVQQIYGAKLANANGSTSGSATIRNGLANSLNIPAVMAMYQNNKGATADCIANAAGNEDAIQACNDNSSKWTIDKIREMGDTSYCTDGADQGVGLASAIGGCGAKQVEHANAFATLGRMGQYRPYASVLSVTDFQGSVLTKWDEEEGVKQVLDPQSAYIINDILTDANARTGTFGYCAPGFCIPNVKTGTKTGTSDIGTRSKDLWFMSYTPKASLSMWWGNHVPAAVNYGDGMSLGAYVQRIMSKTHLDVFAKDGEYTANQWFDQPEGIQKINVSGREDLFPSWYIRDNVSIVQEPTVFDKLSKKLATECTPENAKETLNVTKTTNHTRGTTTYQAPAGYDRDHYDDIHSCDASAQPAIISATATSNSTNSTIRVSVSPGNNSMSAISSVLFRVNGTTYQGAAESGTSWTATVPNPSSSGVVNVEITVTDNAFYSVSRTLPITFSIP